MRLNFLIIFLLMLTLLFQVLPMPAYASSSINRESYSSTKNKIASWDPSWPLNDYRLNFYLTVHLQGSNTLLFSKDKDLISPGETVSLSIELQQGAYSLRVDPEANVIKKSTGESWNKSVSMNLGSIKVPSTWVSPQISVPVIPLEVIGIPVELSIMFRIYITSVYSIDLDLYGLKPSNTRFDFEQEGSKSITCTKPHGVGAEITMTRTAANFSANVAMSAGLSISGVPTPLKIDFATVPISKFSAINSQPNALAVLKTPISVNIDSIPSVVNLGDTVQLTGHIDPSAGDLQLYLNINNKNVASTRTQSDGTFAFDWHPNEAGTPHLFLECIGKISAIGILTKLGLIVLQ